MTHIPSNPSDVPLPEMPGCPPPTSPARRRILSWLAGLTGTIAVACAGVPILGFLLSPMRNKSSSKLISLGKLDTFAIGATQLVTFDSPAATQPWTGIVARTAAYVRRLSDTEFQVFAVNCTHLGCPVSWFPQSGLFMCPCHGGVYYENGDHASGPPPRPLYQYSYEITDGELKAYVGHMPTLQDLPEVYKPKS
ncbi:MAG: Rieske 2Fe-2S domain-containing protein [Planctomycetes bacterium]|nr:Rieske 2Fe-2S domain-containing protein [Planctomycetota bacterium]